MKKFIMGFVSASILFCGISFADEIKTTVMNCSVSMNGSNRDITDPILNYNGRAYVPLRTFANICDVNTVWDAESKTIKLEHFVKVETKEVIKEVPVEKIVTKEVPVEIVREVNNNPNGQYGKLWVTYTDGYYTIFDRNDNNTGYGFTFDLKGMYIATYANKVVTSSFVMLPPISGSNISAPTSSLLTSSVVESQIDSDFNGFESNNIYELSNGQIWKQTSYDYEYHYAYRPKVIIYKDSYGSYKMKVDGCTDTPTVVRLK